MAQKKKVELTRLQGGIAIASFSSGVTIAAVCLFFIPPLGEIASSAEGRLHINRISTLARK